MSMIDGWYEEKPEQMKSLELEPSSERIRGVLIDQVTKKYEDSIQYAEIIDNGLMLFRRDPEKESTKQDLVASTQGGP